MGEGLIVGAPVKDRAWVLPEWHQGLSGYPAVCLLSRSEDDSRSVLEDLGVEVVEDPEEGRPVHEIEGHVWNLGIAAFEYMARLRNRLLDLMIERGAEYFFSVDTDIVLPPNAIPDLLSIMEQTGADVISPAVCLCSDPVEWNTMNWGGYEGAAWRDYIPQRTGTVDVIMAAMLLNRRAIESCRWAPHVQGEDVGFCALAEQLGISRWWVPEIACEHMMFREEIRS